VAHLLERGNTPCLIIEVISPAGFEDYFRKIAEVWGKGMQRVEEINEKYRLDMDFESVPRLCERFGLTDPSSE
jgi:hypothetical protein